MQDVWIDWAAVALSVLMAIGYEWVVIRRAERDPTGVARTAHGDVRAAWAFALGRHKGSEIIAVQTLRNSLMSATIVASTAALALMGSISLVAPAISRGEALLDPTPGRVIELLLMTVLFASFVCAALAMRLYNHAGFLMAFPVESSQRRALDPVAALYLRRAGFCYSWSLRLFFCVAPLVSGLVAPILMPVATLGLVWALKMFDRPPPAWGGLAALEASQDATARADAASEAAAAARGAARGPDAVVAGSRADSKTRP
jgi:Protein of unknown function, DUF599